MPGISPAVRDALNYQVNAEIYSAYLYLSMSSYCDFNNFPGAAHWLRLQWEEELAHAIKLIDFVTERGGKASLEAIDKPPEEFGSLLQLFEQVLEHEQQVTASIYQIYDLSLTEKDYASQSLLQWYANEQVEEEKSAADIVSTLKLAGDSGPALLIIDGQLAQRTKSPPQSA